MAATPVYIEQVVSRRVWDSRGRPTVEAEVVLSDGARGRAIAPAGASRGAREAVDLRDGGPAFGGLGVATALSRLRSEIAPALLGMAAHDQGSVDRRLMDLDGTANMARLGGNATIAASMAVLHASARSAGQPLWRHLAGERPARLPMPMIQIFGGGAHAARRLDLQDILMIPLAAQSFDTALVMCAEVYRAAGRIMEERGALSGVADEGGWWPQFASNEEAIETAARAIEAAGFRPGEDVALALDVAASQFLQGGEYVLAAEKRRFDSDGLIELVGDWCARFPIVSVEDPVAETDTAGMIDFTRRHGERIQVVGDDYLVTSAEQVTAAAAAGACNALLVKPNQAGTVTQALAAFDAARGAGWRTVVSARSGETEDVTIVHLAVGWGADQLKVGSFARSERMAKWNEGLRIEEALPAGDSFAGRAALGAVAPAGLQARPEIDSDH
jgi:enolase